MATGRLGEAGAALASSGDVQGAVRLWLKGGRARRAASLLLQHSSLLRDNELVDAVHTQLIQVFGTLLLLHSYSVVTWDNSDQDETVRKVKNDAHIYQK